MIFIFSPSRYKTLIVVNIDLCFAELYHLALSKRCLNTFICNVNQLIIFRWLKMNVDKAFENFRITT